MERSICATCGHQFSARAEQPEGCPICLDERQYVGHQGQEWTTLAAMQQQGYRNEITALEPNLYSIRTTPEFAIGQWANLIRTPQGNVLWDCISYIDEETVEAVRALGGIRAIAISHPHYYSTMVEWAERFDATIYLPEADRAWVMNPSERITYWSGPTYSLGEGLTVLRLGGHFPGSSALHWSEGAGGQGAIFTGDTIMVTGDRRWVSFMYSYPNLIPLPSREVERIASSVLAYPFDRIYGAWPSKVVESGGQDAVRRSADRYVKALAGELSQDDRTE